MKEGCEDLKGGKYDWLTNRDNMSEKQEIRFRALRDSPLKTACAGHQGDSDVVMAIQEQDLGAQGLGAIVVVGDALLEPVKAVGVTIRKHLWGTLNAVVLKVTNGPAECINSRIKMIKIRRRGFRNKQRFANAIYFHLGGWFYILITSTDDPTYSIWGRANNL